MKELTWYNIGRNLQAAIDGDELLVKTNLKMTFGESKSGKSLQIATSNGNISLPFPEFADVRMGINIYKPI